MAPPPGARQDLAPGGAPLPRRGVFATSEVIPLIQQAAQQMNDARLEWQRLREEADQKKANAKRVRANLIVRLRVWGNEGTGDQPIKTSAERQEWADADPDVQQAELEADLAQTLQMVTRGRYDDAQAFFSTLQTMQAMERDEARREFNGPAQ